MSTSRKRGIRTHLQQFVDRSRQKLYEKCSIPMDSIYTRRLPARWIRILAVQPGTSSDPIRISLREASIDDAPSFQALSYVWGDPSHRKHVQFNSSTSTSTSTSRAVPVTKSLFDALHHLRLPDRDLLLWADALCINQCDMDERAAQVQLMRDVYSRAHTVVVWLGLDDDEGQAARAIPLMKTIYRTCEAHTLAKGVDLIDMAHFTPAKHAWDGLAGVSVAAITAMAREQQQQQQQQATGTCHHTAESWAALGWMLSRPWFTRVWCVQEIALAQSSTVFLGPYSFDWKQMGVTAAWLNAQHLATDYAVPPELKGLPWENAYSMFDTRALAEASLLDLLATFRDFAATDPRDKVYGLLGLVDDAALSGFSSSAVDYRKSVVDVYMDVVKASVASSGSLVSLCYAKHGLGYERRSFPSWVPRWDLGEDVCSILHSLSVTAWEEGDKHGLPLLKTFQPSADGKVSLAGVRFDTIRWTTDVLDIEHFKDDLSPSEASKHPLLETWHRASSNTRYAQFPPSSHHHHHHHPSPGVREMARTLTTGFTDGYELVAQLTADEQRRFYADYLAYTRQLFDKSAGQEPATTFFAPCDMALYDAGDASRFRTAASRSCDQRRVFETATGFFGLAPACATQGDVVVLLYGGPIPFALRRVDDGWVFLGDCFVGPLMPESADETIRERFGGEEVFLLV